MTTRHAPPPPRWPASHVAVGVGAWVVGATALVMGAVDLGGAISPDVATTAAQPTASAQRTAVASLHIAPPAPPSIGAVPEHTDPGKAPGDAAPAGGGQVVPQGTAGAPAGGQRPTVTVTVTVTATLAPPVDTTRPTDIPTATPTGPCWSHLPAGPVPCTTEPEPTPTAPTTTATATETTATETTATAADPAPTTPADVIDHVIDHVIDQLLGQETP